jgi:hypothetical protein
MRDHLVQWTLKDRHGDIVPINSDNILRLDMGLYDEIYKLVMQASDDDADETAEEAAAKN